MVQLNEIESSELIERNRPEEDVIDNLTLAVGILFLPLANFPQYLSVYGYVGNKTSIVTSIEMAPCQKSQWPDIDQETFDVYDIGSCYCPTEADRHKVALKGYFTSDVVHYLWFGIKRCDDALSSVPCAPSA